MWNKLSMNDRAKYIQLGVANGITSLDVIRDTYNKYAEGGDTTGEPLFTKDFFKEVGLGMIPIYGSYRDVKEFIDNPSWENAGWAGLSLLTEIPIFKLAKLTKVAKVAKQVDNATSNIAKIEKRIDRLNRSPRTKKSYWYKQHTLLDQAKREKALLEMELKDWNDVVGPSSQGLYWLNQGTAETIENMTKKAP